jgi:chaperonin GroES
LHDRVVIRRLDAEEKSAGGIIIPDTAREKPMEGEVVAAGPGARDEQGHIVALEVKAGDRILFGKWSGTEVKLDRQEKGRVTRPHQRFQEGPHKWLQKTFGSATMPVSVCCAVSMYLPRR